MLALQWSHWLRSHWLWRSQIDADAAGDRREPLGRLRAAGARMQMMQNRENPPADDAGGDAGGAEIVGESLDQAGAQLVELIQ
jgi:hypothetical protein